MRKRSNLDLEKFAPIRLDPDFPVSEPEFNSRGENPGVAPHIHDALELGYCFEGSGVFLIGKKMFSFKSGDAVVINSREVHIAKSNPGGTTSWGWMYLDPLHLLAENAGSLGECLSISRYCGSSFNNVIDSSLHPLITDCIRRMMLEYRDKHKNYRDMVRALTWQLMIFLRRYYEAGPPSPEEPVQDFSAVARIVPALEYIGENLEKNISVTELARLCFTSQPNFRKLFIKALQCPPQAYIQKLRLNIASALLKNTDTPILSIAQSSGFNNISNFNRQFKSHFGVSPRQYRKEE